MVDTPDSTVAAQPVTPYPDVNAAVHFLLTGIQAVIGAQLVGMYLVGSLAVGDFRPRNSDLDLIIVTRGALSEKIVASLRDLHHRFDHSASPWAARLDAAYIPQQVVRESPQTTDRYPRLEWPGLLALQGLEREWAIQRYTLREHGIVVS